VGERTQSESSAWPGGIAAITLFVEDLGATRRFYEDVFRLPVHYEDEDSIVFKFGDTLVNLLTAGQAPSLVEPATVAPPESGVRFQFTLGVEDVDAMCAELEERGCRVAQRADGSTLGSPHCELPRSRRSHLGNRPLGRRAARR